MSSRHEPDPPGIPPYPGTPRWVGVCGLFAAALLLLVLYGLVLGGGVHGPARHAAAQEGAAHSGARGLALLGALLLATVALTGGWLADRGLLPARWPGSSSITGRAWRPMGPRLRKVALTAHVTSSVGWLGAVVAYLTLDITAVVSPNVPTVRAAYEAMDLVIWYAIVPLAHATLLIGTAIALGTPWGLVRHYWVLVKLLLTGLATIVLVQEAQVVSRLADTASSIADPRLLPGTLLHSAGALALLIAIAGLAIFKPEGTTRHGWRRRYDRP